MARITKKLMAVNNPNDLRQRYLVNNRYIFPDKAKAKAFAKYLGKRK